MKTAEINIKPCPHCGGVGKLKSQYSYKTRKYFVYVKCSECGAQGTTCTEFIEEDPENPSYIKAVESWNKRIYE